MKKTQLFFVSAVMGLAVLGVAVMQFYYLQNISELQQAGFKQSVSLALEEVKSRLEEDDFITAFEHQSKVKQEFDKEKNEAKKRSTLDKKTKDGGVIARRFDKMQSSFYRDMFPSFDRTFLHHSPPEHEKTIRKRFADSVMYLRNQVLMLEKLAKNLLRNRTPLKSRIKKEYLDKLLSTELQRQGIQLSYYYEVYSTKNNELLFSSGNKPDEDESVYQHHFFNGHTVGNEEGLLKLMFIGGDKYLMGQMLVLVNVSILLLLLMLASVIYTIHSVRKQKKIADIKAEFINNMTHEFKTPVATIMIASEALLEDQVVVQPDKVKRMAKIISAENNRLSNHVERVLNIAKLELKDFKLNCIPVDIHYIIRKIADAMQLQVETQKANLVLSLRAENPTILGDEFHLSNVILNLLDNALKYSKDNARIEISTSNTKKELVISVLDNGIGIAKSEFSKIFDQFYRVSTGDVHNVKGFGLGLNYVNTVVKKLEGTIQVKSEKEQGTEFILTFILI